jgi:hypothetical protein
MQHGVVEPDGSGSPRFSSVVVATAPAAVDDDRLVVKPCGRHGRASEVHLVDRLRIVFPSDDAATEFQHDRHSPR